MILSTRSASLVKRFRLFRLSRLAAGQILEQGGERLRVGLDQSQFGLRHAANVASPVGRGKPRPTAMGISADRRRLNGAKIGADFFSAGDAKRVRTCRRAPRSSP